MDRWLFAYNSVSFGPSSLPRSSRFERDLFTLACDFYAAKMLNYLEIFNPHAHPSPHQSV
jgi:hypothetical protein